jgi:hypothetical protein
MISATRTPQIGRQAPDAAPGGGHSGNISALKVERISQHENPTGTCTGDSLNQRIVLDTIGEALLLIPVAVKATMQK